MGSGAHSELIQGLEWGWKGQALLRAEGAKWGVRRAGLLFSGWREEEAWPSLRARSWGGGRQAV